MHLLNSLRVLEGRTSMRLRSCEALIIKKKGEIRNVEAGIERQHQIIDAAKNHLQSFIIVGCVQLSDIVESKTRQATVRRKIAESELQHAELNTQKRELEQELKVALNNKHMLLRKVDRVAENVSRVRREEHNRMLNGIDNETEEQINWNA